MEKQCKKPTFEPLLMSKEEYTDKQKNKNNMCHLVYELIHTGDYQSLVIRAICSSPIRADIFKKFLEEKNGKSKNVTVYIDKVLMNHLIGSKY